MSDWKNVQYKDGKMRTSEGGGGGSSTFAGLDDVSFNDIQNGQVPKYNSETHKWENADESGGGGTVTDVEVDGVSVVNQQGVAEIEMPNVPVQDVQVGGTSVVNAQGVAEITMPTPPTPDYPVTDVKVNGTSVVSNKQALITSYKEVTQAQYEALPSSKNSDGILYCIKDSAVADGFPPLIYSLEEREIGVWTDGKPLYQKTYEITSVVFGGVTNNNNLVLTPEIEIKNYEGYILRSNNRLDGFIKGYHDSINDIVANQNVSQMTIRRQSASPNNAVIQFSVASALQSDFQKVIVTVQYTKSTDTAGSGTWITDGTYAHHYSTSEKVIGTWIDGKPLYEKTFDFGQDLVIVAQDWSDTPILKGNIERIIYGEIRNTNYAVWPIAIRTNVSSNYVQIMNMRPSGSNINTRYFTIRYTKTT